MQIIMKKWLKRLCISGIVLLVFGCKSNAQEETERKDLAGQTLSTTTYNYTKFELYDINFMNASRKFEIEKASPGESVFFRNAGHENLEDGTKVSFGSGACCFIWNNNKNDPVKIRVVWNLIYNLGWFEGPESQHYDNRVTKHPQPGSVWCEAIVDISQPYPMKPDTFYLHFFPDGTVAAHISKQGDLKSNGPLPIGEIKKHLTPLPNDKHCLKETQNPWNGISRKPHVE